MEKLKVHDKYFVSNVIHFGYIVFQTSERICFLREFGGFFLFIIIRPVFFLSEIKKKHLKMSDIFILDMGNFYISQDIKM